MYSLSNHVYIFSKRVEKERDLRGQRVAVSDMDLRTQSIAKQKCMALGGIATELQSRWICSRRRSNIIVRGVGVAIGQLFGINLEGVELLVSASITQRCRARHLLRH